MATVLTAHGKNLPRKTFVPSPTGGLEKKQSAPQIAAWHHKAVDLSPDVETLAGQLADIAANPRCAVVMDDTLIDGKDGRRLYHPQTSPTGIVTPATVKEGHNPVAVLDIDKCPLPFNLEADNPVAAIEHIAAMAGLGDASYVWQISASSVAQILTPCISVRLWVPVSEAITPSQNKLFAASINERVGGAALCDLAQSNKGQIVFTAGPEIRGNGINPFAQMIGFIHGAKPVLQWTTPVVQTKARTYDGTQGTVTAPKSFDDAVSRIGAASLHGAVNIAAWVGVRAGMSTESIITAIHIHCATVTEWGGRDAGYINAETTGSAISRSCQGARARLAVSATPVELPIYRQTEKPEAISLFMARKRLPNELLTAMRQGGFHLHVGPPGLGKSFAISSLPVPKGNLIGWISQGEQITIATPTIELASQLAKDINTTHGRPVALVLRGRTQVNPSTGLPMCKRAELVASLIKAGMPSAISKAVCGTEFTPANERCPHTSGCPWVKQKQAMSYHAIHIIPHETLFNGHSTAWRTADTLIVDESPLSTAVTAWHPSVDSEQFSTLMAAIPIGYDAAPWPVLCHALTQGANPSEFVGAMATAQAFVALAKMKETPLGGIHAGMSDVAIQMALMSVAAPRYPAGWQGACRAAARVMAGESVNEIYLGADGKLRGAWRRPPKINARATIGLDGTAVPMLWQALMGSEPVLMGAPILQADINVDVVQDTRESFAKSAWWTPGTDATPTTDAVPGKPQNRAIGRLLFEAGQIGAGCAIIGQQSLVTGLPEGIPQAHFNALRGLNRLESATGLVVAGRIEPQATAIEAVARALWPSESLTLTGRWQRQRAAIELVGGGTEWVELDGHEDVRVSAVLSAMRDAELSQAIARIRPLKSGPRRKVVVLGRVPCGYRVTIAKDVVPPAAVLRFFGGTLQADVLPLGKKVLEACGFNPEACREVVAFAENYGGLSLNRISIKQESPLISGYRVAGSRGKPSRVFLLNGRTQAIEALSKIHGGRPCEWLQAADEKPAAVTMAATTPAPTCQATTAPSRRTLTWRKSSRYPRERVGGVCPPPPPSDGRRWLIGGDG